MPSFKPRPKPVWAISKRRPRQNIIAMILKKAKGSGSSTARRSSTKGLDASQHSESAKRPSRSRAILQSAADITGRLSQRSTRKKPRSGKGGGISKGQKAFYRSSKGICKVTVVGVHHDAKLEPYYTIKLRDGKEKQVGGKHLTPVQDVEKSIKKDSRHGEKSDSIKKGSSHGESVTKSVTVESKKGSTTGTDQTFESTSDEGSAAVSSDDNVSSDLDGQFATGQSAYYCSSDGHVSKVKVIKVYSSSSSSEHKYSVHLPDGTSKDVDSDQLKALINLTSDELAVLMKEKNEKPSSNKEIPALTPTEDVDPGYEAGKSESSQETQETAEQKSTDGNQEPLALPCSFEMVEAKTEEGGTKMVPRYAARTKLYYKNADGIQMATILESHLDDLLDPYYSIRLADGREKQTDNAHLLMNLPEGEGAEVKKEEQHEEMKQKAEVAMAQSEESNEKESPTSETMVEKIALDTQPKQETVAELSPVPVNETNKAKTLGNSGNSDVGQEATPKVKKQVDPAASALTFVHNFSLREVVLYSSSQGEHYRATVVKLLKDKKHRPYYVVRLPDGKEKQVYDHRLSPIRIGRADSSVDESKRSGRSRSATLRRSLSEAPSSRKTLSRADSNDSHGISNTRSRRASISSDEKRKSLSRSKSLSRRSVSRGPSRARSRSRGLSANEDARLSIKSLRKSIR